MAAPLVLGAVAHLIVSRLDLDFDARPWRRLVSVFAGGLVALFVYNVSTLHLGLFGALKQTTVSATLFSLAFFISMSIYRLYFHRLRSFPGPKLAALSQFYAMWLAAKDMKLMVELQKLHQQYGDVVRIGPRYLSINKPSAIQPIYGPPLRCRKGAWYSQTGGDVELCSLNQTRDPELHRLRRRAWDRAFSTKALASYEPRVAQKVDNLVNALRARKDQPINMTKWAALWAFDIMGDVGLGKQFSTLDTGEEHPAIKAVHGNMYIAGLFGPVPWLISLLTAIPGAAAGIQDFQKYCADAVSEKEKTFEGDTEPTDILSWIMKAKHEHDRSAPPSEIALHEDSRLIIAAGSDTSANALTNTLYYLARNPTALARLQAEADAAFPRGDADWTAEAAKGLPFVDAVINEAMRLRPPAVAAMPRFTPPEGLRVDDVFIPGNVTVAVPPWTLHRDPRCFERPDDFVPERWLDGKLSTEAGGYIPFSRGPGNCAGKAFAKLELRLVLSRLALNFDVAFAGDGTEEVFEDRQMDTITLTLPELNFRMTPRPAASRD